MNPMPIGKLLPTFLEAKRVAGCRECYVTSLRWYLTAFAKGRENRPIASFTVEDLDEWFSARKESPVTINSNVGRLASFFQFAWRRGYITDNPCRRLERRRKDEKMPDILTVEQCREALEWAAEKEHRHLGWLVLTLIVGLRPESEADLIEWDNLNLAGARLVVTRSKTRRNRIIDLRQIPNAVEWLILAKERDSEFPGVYMARRRFVRRLRNHLGFERWPQDVLRHSAASYLYAKWQDAGKVAALLGNSAGTLLKHYRQLVAEEEAIRFFSITPQRSRESLRGWIDRLAA